MWQLYLAMTCINPDKSVHLPSKNSDLVLADVQALCEPLMGTHDSMFYRNGHKFSDINVRANSADPDQTAPRGAV